MLRNESKVCGFEFDHPLLCPLVLEHIFKDLELKDLKTCRLVCQYWSAMSLLQSKNSRRNPKVRISLCDENIQQFLNNEPGLCEFQHFKFNYSIKSEPNIKEFLNLPPRNNHKDIIFVIGMDGENDDVNFNSTDKFLSFLAENSSKLKSFGLKIYKDKSRVPSTTDFESFEINWTKLKSLVLWYVTDSRIFLPILERASKLERLVVYEGVPYNICYTFLENLIHTLIEFEFHEDTRIPFDGEENYRHNIDTLPRFTKLKRLKITRKYYRPYNLTIPSLPELSEMYLKFKATPRPRFEDLAIFPKLKSLDWNWDYNYLTDNDNVKKFPDMFPNLKRFRHTRHSITAPAWEYMSGIEELSCSDLDDMAVMGFYHNFTLTLPPNNPVDWSGIYNSEREREKCSIKFHNQEVGIQILSELKRLTVSVPEISNASIIFGLLKCKSLRSVQLLSPSPFLTREILVWMADDLNLMNLSIDVGNRDWSSSPQANYFRTKHPNCQLVFPYKQPN